MMTLKWIFDTRVYESEKTVCIGKELIEREIKYTGTIYLTFDDGPGDYTNELLNILARQHVKATFFVTGNGEDEMIAREYREGHAVGLHTLSHNYFYIYSSVDNFFDDLYAVQERVKNITGQTSMLMRFPGGSSNTVSRRYQRGIMSELTAEVEARGFTYFDWNVLSGDAGETTDTGEVVWRVTSALREGENVVLQHDIKDFSVAAVEEIIKFGKDNGYKFDKLSSKSFTAHHGVNN
ncbi:polysaccharide deacetylase [Candidatus Saccharibacteria bacterium]|nr:polysaccharide deacetylase [Candidatus Saccharibacteria bacterium]